MSYAVDLASRLIKCPSVTPTEGGALDLLQAELDRIGFACTRLPFGEDGEQIDNLFASWGSGQPHFAFAGHTDVVPPGAVASWTHDPFSGLIDNGILHGRGAADMKGGIAAFVAAARQAVEDGFGGRISLIITGDEEGKAVYGTDKMVDWLAEQNIVPDMCLVAEPTNPSFLGEVIKNGRRGSLTGQLEVTGIQGHVAYPHLARNPLPGLLAMLAPVTSQQMDSGTDWFDPSTAEVTRLESDGGADNVIPQTASARFNIRFNTEHSQESLKAGLEAHFAKVAAAHDLIWQVGWHCTAEPFVTEPGQLTDLIAGAAEEITGQRPALSTSGGTSDARFLCRLCPVAEFGLVGKTMHRIDEQVATADIDQLTAIYSTILGRLESA
ncbi:MAG: succinyl-diaminopimelate desuccinylase [Alphaproteobacteria bacterium]|jgi:succinyl-diaminopimelate desuccinylase|nr:succinyl-diaminopimelate desuccinylase [Alphaproteobacteria bacterium]